MPVEQGLQFELVEDLLEPLDFRRHLGGERLVLVGHLEHRRQVVGRGDGFVERLDDGRQRLELADFLLGFLLIVPEAGSCHLLLDLGDALLLASVVKESP